MPNLKKTLAWCVCCAVVLAVWPSRTAEAPVAAERVIFSNGQVLATTGRSTVGDGLVLQLRDGGELAIVPELIARIDVDDAGLPRPAEAMAMARASAGPALPARPYAEIVAVASARHGVDPLLVHALIETESAYRADAISSHGALGLMQLMPATVKSLGVDDPYDPATNIDAGTRYLRSLLDKFGTRGALAAYNAGEAAVRQFNGVPPYRETRHFVGRVLALVDAHRDAESGDNVN
ncbi:MAG: lytic transglycosylase domain-containing protein [Acidobacteria bacterium]|nr:lytic transglycosylase domain-containing protein [Acidobacteriota bacterium]MYJ05318.1 lytic transglycosylase domain-containing protein [Acidobacteriota bacterium]